MTFLNIVGPKVKQARLTQQPLLTQNELAIRLQILGWDIDRFGISKLERGERQVTDKELLLLAKALNVSILVLLNEE
jgi:transcriptional regulator with XRE-family HTH domain